MKSSLTRRYLTRFGSQTSLSGAYSPGSRLSREDALVVAHRELGLDLFHRFEGDTDHDQDRHSGEGDLDVPHRTGDGGKDGDRRQEDRAGEKRMPMYHQLTAWAPAPRFSSIHR